MSQSYKQRASGKESAHNVGDLSSVPGLGRSPGEGKGYPLQYSGLENSMDCIVHAVTKTQTRLSDLHFHFQRSKVNTLRSCNEEVAICIRAYSVLTHLCGFSRTCSLSETLHGIARVLFRRLDGRGGEAEDGQRRAGGEKEGLLGTSGGQLCPALRQLDKTEQDKTIWASGAPPGLSLRSEQHASLATQRRTQGGALGQGTDGSEPEARRQGSPVFPPSL